MNGCIEIINMKYYVTNAWTNKTFAPCLELLYRCQKFFSITRLIRNYAFEET
jgi:hypothetical protein